MILHQHYRHQHLTFAQLDDRDLPLGDELLGLFNAYLHRTPLLHAVTDGAYTHDPAGLLTREATLGRFMLHLHAPPETIHAAVQREGGLTNLATCEWASLETHLVEDNPAPIYAVHAAKPLRYEGCFGLYHQPKRYRFQVMAHSPVDAWRKVTLSLVDILPQPDLLTLFEVKRGTTSLHDFLTRDLPEADGMADPLTARLWRALCEQEDQVMARARELPSNDRGFFPSDIAFLVKELMVRSYELEQEAQVDYPRLADAIYRALLAGTSLAEHPPLRVHQPLTFHDEHDMAVTPSADMFAFTQCDQQAMTVPPDMRFLLLHNIPPGRDLTMREQQAWCDYYLTRKQQKTA